MRIEPYRLIRIANAESTRLSLRVDLSPCAVVLTPRFGEARTIALEDGEFAFPFLEAPDSARVEWIDEDETSIAITYAEIVSSHYFSLDSLRSHGDGQDDFGALDDDILWMARQAATEVFERNAHRSFVHRLGRTKDYGYNSFIYLDDNDVYRLLTDGYRLVSDCQVERCISEAKSFPVWVEYLYGTDYIPAQVSRAVLELAAYMLRPTNRPIGATGESTDAGYIHFTTAGRDGATDIPEVNAAIDQFGRGVRYVW